MSSIKHYTQPAFLICTVLLALSAGGMSLAIKCFDVYLEKEPLSLKKPLNLLDEDALLPYKVVTKRIIENEDVIKTLGTEDYIQWILEDPEVESDSPVRRYMLFVTYYGLADRVPHVPEECYTGGGYQKVTSDSIIFEVTQADLEESAAGGKKTALRTKQIGGKYLVFENTGTGNLWMTHKFPVLYLFRVNGKYAGNREEARIALGRNLFRKFSYFSKVEIVFNQNLKEPTKEDVIIASQKLLGVVLPILEKEHWPNWEK